MLGEMISSGTGCNPDAVEACYWLSLALAQGQIDARSSLETAQKELSEDDLQRVYARSMQTLLESVQYWSEVNRELAVIHERYPVCSDSVDLHGQAAVREKGLVTAKGEAPINLDHAEILRQKARLTIDEFAKLVGVTRMTYHTWRGGGPIRNSNRTRLETVVTGLERLFASPEWPVVEVELLTTAGKESVLRRAIEQVRQPRL
jgi:DNA-binding transcriptional regulator YiaG